MSMELYVNRKNKKKMRLIDELGHSFDGLRYAYQYEQSMTIHLCTMFMIAIFGNAFQINRIEWVICILLLGLIAAIELINTSLEAVVDLVSPQIHPLAKVAKDTASAAVFVFSTAAFIGWAIIFIPKVIDVTFVLLS